MELLTKLLATKENINMVVFPLLAVAYLSYFPMSSTQIDDISSLLNISVVFGMIWHLIFSIFVAIIFYAAIFSFANYLEAHQSIPMFTLMGTMLLVIALAPFFEVKEFMWVKPPLSYALAAVSMSFLLVVEKEDDKKKS